MLGARLSNSYCALKVINYSGNCGEYVSLCVAVPLIRLEVTKYCIICCVVYNRVRVNASFDLSLKLKWE